jgi:hypothetical protein
MKLLSENKFNVAWRKIPHVFLITFIIILFSPLALVEKIISWNRIRRVKLKHPPIFILGHWRQGTTFLHELFNSNPEFEVMTLIESIFPNHFLYSSSIVKWFFSLFLPETRPQDDLKIYADIPSEHDFALANLSSTSPYSGAYFPENQDFYIKYVTMEDFDEKKIEKVKKSYELVIKKLTLRKKHKQLVLKSPVDTARVELLLELFPDAKFIHIARNPYEVFYSTRRMYEKLVPVFQLQNTYPDLDEFIFYIYEGMYQRFFNDISKIPEGNYAEVRYEQFIQNPLDVMKGVYEKLSLPGYEKAEPFIQQYLDKHKDYSPTAYTFPPEELKLIYSKWHEIFKMMKYEG